MQATSKIILGTVQFGLVYGINNSSGKPTQEKVNEILYAAYDGGIRCLDTAAAYGDAHQVIGRFHQSYPDRKFDVITKLPHHLDGNLDEKIRKYLEDLNVSYLHGLLFHSYQTYKESSSLTKSLQSYKEKGTVKYIGVSVYTNEQAEDVAKDNAINIIQLPFNLFDNINLRGDVLKSARNNGKIIHTRSAFLQGLFFTSLQRKNKISEALTKELRLISRISEVHQIPLQKLALNYCLQQPEIDNVLIGIDNLEQLKQNLEYTGDNLSEDTINEVNQIFVKNSDLLNPSLWK